MIAAEPITTTIAAAANAAPRARRLRARRLITARSGAGRLRTGASQDSSWSRRSSSRIARPLSVLNSRMLNVWMPSDPLLSVRMLSVRMLSARMPSARMRSEFTFQPPAPGRETPLDGAARDAPFPGDLLDWQIGHIVQDQRLPFAQRQLQQRQAQGGEGQRIGRFRFLAAPGTEQFRREP